MYYLFTEGFSTPTFVGKGMSVAIATFLNYYLNKSWTWGQNNRNNKRFAKYMMLYAVSGMLNVVSNEIFLRILPEQEFQMSIADAITGIQKPFIAFKLGKFLAVIGATLVGMIVNFVGQKLWVFKQSDQ
jgi:putative flippase GtrA